MVYEFEMKGKLYSFAFDPDTDDPAEGATLTYVSDAATGSRLNPKEADSHAWTVANYHFGLPVNDAA